ncbi:tRNA (adenosine(37)-N6)-threonylcarbamoyltransferase complex ATPase subunit type 1 TsaE [Kineococcus rubinsiae]|uniref:tRNA (adenosine(37)-N6)-threonylcarbamoyltransferase complex ATPase subunit type 1 TsaE n=1 Tax=Kineococcus rubinsiae TaxID=2609562 RepID=UPI00142FC41E|nr:tRNA (adenosine(37)-N6)-threonylcarbamoyltransferase complex ATPase subunit type 1 TsaE [Kineococcus rubinsiae]NIZ93617.1 tRNA (adenosine(37)-N6)-threonylcarbamoyltransferase complex ATPase subunit type 1 TsaE [Kineococcus rubinsiae]
MSEPGSGAVSEARGQLATAQETAALGRRLAAVLRAGDLLVLAGDLGAGKTTLTQGIADGLGVRGPVTSPTFVIARVHPSLVGGPPLVHVDAYRLGSLAEVEDLDLEASAAEAVTVVEWGAGLVEDLAGDRLEVDLVRPHGAGAAAAHPDEVPVEPRAVQLRAAGPRWSGVDLTRLLA